MANNTIDRSKIAKTLQIEFLSSQQLPYTPEFQFEAPMDYIDDHEINIQEAVERELGLSSPSRKNFFNCASFETTFT